MNRHIQQHAQAGDEQRVLRGLEAGDPQRIIEQVIDEQIGDQDPRAPCRHEHQGHPPRDRGRLRDAWILEAMKDRGIFIGKTGAGRNVLTFLPPLVIEEADVDAVVAALRECLKEETERGR